MIQCPFRRHSALSCRLRCLLQFEDGLDYGTTRSRAAFGNMNLTGWLPTGPGLSVSLKKCGSIEVKLSLCPRFLLLGGARSRRQCELQVLPGALLFQ